MWPIPTTSEWGTAVNPKTDYPTCSVGDGLEVVTVIAEVARVSQRTLIARDSFDMAGVAS